MMRILLILVLMISTNITNAAIKELSCLYREASDGINKEIKTEFEFERIAKMEFDTAEFRVYASAITGVRNFKRWYHFTMFKITHLETGIVADSALLNQDISSFYNHELDVPGLDLRIREGVGLHIHCQFK